MAGLKRIWQNSTISFASQFQLSLDENIYRTIPHVSLTTQSVKELNWTARWTKRVVKASFLKTHCNREGIQPRDARRYCKLVIRKRPTKVFIRLKHLFSTCKTDRSNVVFCDVCVLLMWVTSTATSTLGKGRQSSPDCSAHWWHQGCSFPFLRHFLHPRKRGSSRGYKNREENNDIRHIRAQLQRFKRKAMAVTLSLVPDWHHLNGDDIWRHAFLFTWNRC